MRTVSIILLCFCFAFSGLAQDGDKAYADMTIEELQSIDTDSLSKSDRRKHKKALRAAKAAEKKRLTAEKKAAKARERAEKKRLAAEKRAEKKRAREEAKRLKREEKERRKHNKKITKRLEFINKIYEETRIIEDDFEAYIKVLGPRYPRESAWLLSRDPVDFYLSALFFPETAGFGLKLITSREIVVDELNSETINSINGSPERYLTRNGYWHNYRRATMRGGRELEIEPAERYLDECTIVRCKFREDTAITLSLDHFSGPLDHAQLLEIKIAGHKGSEYFVRLTPEFISGFLEALAEVGEPLADLKKATAVHRKRLQNQLKVAPLGTSIPK